jgi:UDP-glucose 4-epimerase
MARLSDLCQWGYYRDNRHLSKPIDCTVIGGGLIATAAALTMHAAGEEVSVVTRAPPPLGGDRLKWMYGDVSSDIAYDAIQRAHSVVYAAGTLGPATKMATVHGAIQAEVVPVLKLAEAAAATGARTFVFISSGGTVYGPDAPVPTPEQVRTSPINAYGMIKALTEQALLEIGRQHGMSMVILRVSNPYGPGQSGTRRLGFVAAAVKMALAEQPLVIWGDGTATRDFVFLDDVGSAIAAAARYGGDSVILNIGSGVENSLRDVCGLVSQHSRKPLEVRYEPGRQFDVPRSCLDITLAYEILGWRPLVTLAEGISRTMQTAL